MSDLITRLKAAQLRGNADPQVTGAGGLLEEAAGRIAELERKLPLMKECVKVAMENLEVVRQELDTLMGDRK